MNLPSATEATQIAVAHVTARRERVVVATTFAIATVLGAIVFGIVDVILPNLKKKQES